MTHRRTVLGSLLAIGLVVVAGWLWYVRLNTPVWNLIEPGKRLTSDNLDIETPTVVVIPPRPGVVYSTVRKPGAQEQFAFIILINYGRRLQSYSTQLLRQKPSPRTLLEHSGKWGQSSAAFELNGNPIEVLYRVELNEKGTAVTNESLTVEGNDVDISAGQVLLLDLTTESPVYRQMKVELPATPTTPVTKEDAERVAEAIRKSLETQDSEIKAFLR